MGKACAICLLLLCWPSLLFAQIPDSEKVIVSPDGLRQAEVTASHELQVFGTVTFVNTSIGISNWLGSVAPTVGQKIMANSLPVVVASNQSPLPVLDTSVALVTGTLGATVVAAPLAVSTPVQQVLVQNLPTNTVNILCGNSTTQSIILQPGDGLTVNVTDLATIYCKTASATGTVGYLAR